MSIAHNLPRMAIITKTLAHVVKDENLFVHEVVKVGPDKFESKFIVDGTHPYLYENAAIANHVSGTTFLDTSRQLLKAITHLYYAVPLANRFVIRTAHMDFTRWAKVRVAILAVVDMTVRKKTILGHSCLTFAGKITWYQDGWQIGTLSGKFMTFSAEIEDQLMSRQYHQVPRAQTGMSASAVRVGSLGALGDQPQNCQGLGLDVPAPLLAGADKCA
jgi:hypothetical protein